MNLGRYFLFLSVSVSLSVSPLEIFESHPQTSKPGLLPALTSGSSSATEKPGLWLYRFFHLITGSRDTGKGGQSSLSCPSDSSEMSVGASEFLPGGYQGF